MQGEILRTRDWLNLRKTPNGEVLGQVPARAQAKVLNGAPTLVDGVYWWNVDVAISTGATLKGWLAQESSQGLMLLERANAGVTPPVVTPPTNPPTNPPTDPGAPVAGLKADLAATVGQQQHCDEVCLLYTSPSPRDRTRSRMPSSA